MDKIKIILQALGALTVAATFIAALTPTSKDDAIVGKISEWVNKIIKFLPTLGINPSTRVLEAKAEAKAEQEK